MHPQSSLSALSAIRSRNKGSADQHVNQVAEQLRSFLFAGHGLDEARYERMSPSLLDTLSVFLSVTYCCPSRLYE